MCATTPRAKLAAVKSLAEETDDYIAGVKEKTLGGAGQKFVWHVCPSCLDRKYPMFRMKGYVKHCEHCGAACKKGFKRVERCDADVESAVPSKRPALEEPTRPAIASPILVAAPFILAPKQRRLLQVARDEPVFEDDGWTPDSPVLGKGANASLQ